MKTESTFPKKRVLYMLCLVALFIFGGGEFCEAQQNVCPGSQVQYSSLPNVNSTYQIEFFVENGTITSSLARNRDEVNNEYARYYSSSSDDNGVIWGIYPHITVRWDNNGQVGKVKVKYTYSWWGLFSSSQTDERIMYIGTPAPTFIAIEGNNADGTVPCYRSTINFRTDNLNIWNAQYNWSSEPNMQLVNNEGTIAQFRMNNYELFSYVYLTVTNRNCPNVSNSLAKSFYRTPRTPEIQGPGNVLPNSTPHYSPPGEGFINTNWTSDWPIIEPGNSGTYVVLRAGSSFNDYSDIVLNYTDACGYSGQVSKRVYTDHIGHRKSTGRETEDSIELVDIVVSPNPVLNDLNLKIPGDGVVSLKLTNIEGRECLVTTAKGGNWKQDISGLPAGQYILQVKSADKVYSKRILKSQ